MIRRNTVFYDSPVGSLEMAFAGEFLVMLDWTDSKKHEANLSRIYPYMTAPVEKSVALLSGMLDEYFEGKRSNIGFDVRLIGSDFEKRVWLSLTGIGYGQRQTYGEVAAGLGCPKSVRAVAGAIGRNPISIVIPCHRVVGAGNYSGGYAGGLEAKIWLLELERGNSSGVIKFPGHGSVN